MKFWLNNEHEKTRDMYCMPMFKFWNNCKSFKVKAKKNQISQLF